MGTHGFAHSTSKDVIVFSTILEALPYHIPSLLTKEKEKKPSGGNTDSL